MGRSSPSFKGDFLMLDHRPGLSPEMRASQACREDVDREGATAAPHQQPCWRMSGIPTESWIGVSVVDYDATLAKIQEAVDGYPGLVRDVQTYLKERIREVLTGASDTVVVRIYGPDLEVLRQKAAEVQAALEGIAGIKDLKKELHVDVPQVDIKVDLTRAQNVGLKPGDIRRATAFLMQGEEVGDIFQGGKTYDVNVWSAPETRNSVDKVSQLLINTPDDGHVRLEQVADVRIVPAPNVIEREGQSRKTDVSANVKERDLGAVIQDVEKALATVDFPLEYRAEILGEFAERQAASQNLAIAGLVAVLAIYFLLYTSFGSWRLASLTFFTLPWALVGGILAAYLTSGVLSLGSLVGLLTILGIATRNGIMMISHFQHLEHEEGMPFGPELVIRGARERISPIMMTALTTGLALIPLVIAGSIPGHEIEHPMSIVIVGGLITSTVLNLFVVPSLYLRFGKSRSSGRGVDSALQSA
jgi:Cu/Ag efflux pump CusA